jgi:hypothetical protein
MYFSIKLARNRRSEYHGMETQINKIENVERWKECEELVTKHDNLKKRLEEKSNYITEGIIVRSKATWYEFGKKSNKYFLTLEKKNKAKTHIKKLLDKDRKEIVEPREILRKIESILAASLKRKHPERKNRRLFEMLNRL